MRKDMAKVVTERPRAGLRLKNPKSYCKQRQKYRLEDYEDSPKYEKIGFKWKMNWSGKEFTDVLGPLRGCIEKHVGRKWDDVFSEICKILPANSLQGSHIRDHVDNMVEKNVMIIDGVPCSSSGRSYGLPLTGGKFYNVFYVDPVDGILKKVLSKKRSKSKVNKNVNSHFIHVNNCIQFHKINGLWYEVRIEKVDLSIFENRILYKSNFRKNYSCYINNFYYEDKILGKKFTNIIMMRIAYGGNYRGLSKRQLNGRELKKHNLHNNSMLAA